jgi:2-polyprenyl-6-methoxyphenol hydroxylase-like FAD-dependent oxidoreductase
MSTHFARDASPVRRRVLISGASFAGPALAFWLHRYGFAVTIVERAAAFRTGGYPIDVRGPAIDVVERMGLLPGLRGAHIGSRRLTFIDREGRSVAEIGPEMMTGGRDVEVPRGVLTKMLFDLTRHDVIYRFGTSIERLVDRGEDVEVTFDDGGCETFDVVIGADGLHSNTRALAFGPESQFEYPIGFCFAGFLTPNTLGLSREAICYNLPGRLAGLYAVGDRPETVHAFLAFAHPRLSEQEARDQHRQRRLTAEAFADCGWKTPELVEAMLAADDFYFDVVQQIRMPRWARGRVALVGDAAHAPSFLTGQGTSLALVGAYILAGELASHADHAAAFAAYDRKLRPFVELNQARIGEGRATLIPVTQEQLEERNRSFRAMTSIDMTSIDTSVDQPPAPTADIHSALALEDYLVTATRP